MAKRRMSTFERLQAGRMNRAERRDLGRRVAASDPKLAIVHANAGGIDVGNESHFVAVPPDRDENPVREFGCWTRALNEMAEWLKSCRIDTVAVQADWCLLDCPLRRSRTAWDPRGAGQRTAHQKRARAEDRRAGMPVADEIAHLRTVARFLPPAAGYVIRAHDLAFTGSARQGCRTRGAAHAEGTDEDERAIG